MTYPTDDDSIMTIQREALRIADAKGWWDFAKREPGPGDYASAAHGLALSPTEIVAQLALVMTEACEAIECVRDGDYFHHDSDVKPGKPEGLPSELADIVIRVAQLAEAMGIDLGAAITVKMRHNAVRQHRHGGRNL